MWRDIYIYQKNGRKKELRGMGCICKDPNDGCIVVCLDELIVCVFCGDTAEIANNSRLRLNQEKEREREKEGEEER